MENTSRTISKIIPSTNRISFGKKRTLPFVTLSRLFHKSIARPAAPSRLGFPRPIRTVLAKPLPVNLCKALYIPLEIVFLLDAEAGGAAQLLTKFGIVHQSGYRG